jgi:acyl-CoA thioesterase FadM
MRPFRRSVTVRFDEADTRGVLFFGRLFELVHRVFEDFVVSELQVAWDDWFLCGQMAVPVKHAEATFYRPLLPGRLYHADVTVAEVGTSSFKVLTRIRETGAGEDLCAETRVVHAFVDPERRKIPVPSAIRARLEACLERQ